MGYWADIVVTYYLVKKFVTPFNKWKAFDLKIIDEKGKILKPVLKTKEERDAFTMLDKAILKIRVTIGDSLFGKLGLLYLLSDYKEQGQILTDDATVFDKAKVILGEGVTVGRIVTSQGESCKFTWEPNDDNTVNFNIGWFYNDYMLSNVGANFIHEKDALNFLSSLRRAFVFESHGIFDTLLHTELVEISYAKNEIKMKKVTDNNKSVTCDLFILFQTDNEKIYFLEGWNKFMEQVTPKASTSPF